MSITIRELSLKLELSVSAVSKALNGYPDISEETRERVLQAAREYGYQPSAAARNLRRQKTNKIGLVFNYPIEWVRDFLSELLPSIASVAEEANYHVTLYTSMHGNADAILKLSRSREFDGMILGWPLDIAGTATIVQSMQNEGVPCVVIPRRLPHPAVSFVAADHYTIGYALAEHLLSIGHHRIGYVGRSDVYETNSDRIVGYRHAHQEAGVPVDEALLIDTDSSVPRNGETALDHFLAMDNPPTAVMFFTDPQAIAALQHAQQQGLRIPEDIAITGCDGSLIASVCNPPLTTVRQPIPDMGRTAVKTLLSLIDDSGQSAIQTTLPAQLIVRGSTVTTD
ncbi:MAG: LacI family DNA-binding transcriptional regulator [Chloroflexota bacterium]